LGATVRERKTYRTGFAEFAALLLYFNGDLGGNLEPPRSIGDEAVQVRVYLEPIASGFPFFFIRPGFRIEEPLNFKTP